jgi:hypothetical protein
MITTMTITRARLKQILKEEIQNVIKEEEQKQFKVDSDPENLKTVRGILNGEEYFYGLNDRGELRVAPDAVKQLSSRGIAVYDGPKDYDPDWSSARRDVGPMTHPRLKDAVKELDPESRQKLLKIAEMGQLDNFINDAAYEAAEDPFSPADPDPDLVHSVTITARVIKDTLEQTKPWRDL